MSHQTSSLSKSIHIAQKTGPLSLINNRNILVLADVENLNYSARDLGYKLSYRQLGDILRQLTKTCALHAFFSREPGNDQWEQYFKNRGWHPHPYDIKTVRTHRGKETLANSDNLILFTTGLLASRSSADVITLGSGDGTMVCDIAQALSHLPKKRTIVTLSLAGSTSHRLNAQTNPHIIANIEIGLDCLHPIS